MKKAVAIIKVIDFERKVENLSIKAISDKGEMQYWIEGRNEDGTFPISVRFSIEEALKNLTDIARDIITQQTKILEEMG